MFDVSQGKERARKWPRPRGKAKTEAQAEQQDWFRQMQWATKYMDSRLMMQAMMAVQGTPLLPRDVLTMLHAGRLLAFNLEDGRRIFPVQAVQDVSQSLDVLGQEPGMILRRGSQYWEGVQQPTPGGWEIHQSWINFTGIVNFDAINIPVCDEIMVIGRNLNYPSAVTTLMRVSTNNGASYFGTVGNYLVLQPDGTTLTAGSAFFYSAARQNNINFVTRIEAPAIAGMAKPCSTLAGGVQRLFVADVNNRINAIRVGANPLAACTGSALHVLVRNAQ